MGPRLRTPAGAPRMSIQTAMTSATDPPLQSRLPLQATDGLSELAPDPKHGDCQWPRCRDGLDRLSRVLRLEIFIA